MNTIQLNTLLKKKAILFNEINLPVDHSVLVKLLIKLKKENYIFTREEFNLFIEQALYIKKGSTICFLKSNKSEHMDITQYMLSQHDLHETQCFTICAICEPFINHNKYGFNYVNNLEYLINFLFEKKYNFPISCLKQLYTLNYISKITKNYTTLNNSIIYVMCMHIFYDYDSRFSLYLRLTKGKQCGFNIEYLDIIIYCLIKTKKTKRSHIRLGDFYKLLDIVFLNLNKNIFQLIMDKNLPSL